MTYLLTGVKCRATSVAKNARKSTRRCASKTVETVETVESVKTVETVETVKTWETVETVETEKTEDLKKHRSLRN